MKNPKTEIKKYIVCFSVDSLHTKAEIYAYSRPDAETLLKKQYSNCCISVTQIEETEK